VQNSFRNVERRIKMLYTLTMQTYANRYGKIEEFTATSNKWIEIVALKNIKFETNLYETSKITRGSELVYFEKKETL